jgi:hypothetical protein
MGLLARGICLSFAIVGVACYEPDLRDCTVACTSAHDCAAGQICGADHFCAEPGVSGTCPASSTSLPGDAGMPPGGDHSDGGMIMPADAGVDAPPDAPTQATLSISIDGKGLVTVQGIGSCTSADPDKGHCTFMVPPDSVTTVNAQADTNFRFDRWTSTTCGGDPFPSCTFVSAAAGAQTVVSVKFRKEDH